jgi:hypothetical protein
MAEVAVVAGFTRGRIAVSPIAGNGLTGRSTRQSSSSMGRHETIEDTAK